MVLPCFAVSALAQDAKDEAAGDDVAEVKPVKKLPKQADKKDDLDDAVKTMPKWESFGGGDDEQVGIDETFFRLATDFVSTSEIGYKRLGEVPIWPRGEIKVGGVRMVPYLRQGAEWESNIFQRSSSDAGTGVRRGSLGRVNGRKGAFSYVSTLGIMADKVLMGGRLRLAGSMQSEWEQRGSSRTGSDTWEFDGQLGATYRWPSGVWVTGGAAWERRADPVEIETSARNEFKRTNKRFFFQSGMDRDIFFGSKFQFELGVAARDVQSRASDFDSAEHSFWEAYFRASYPFLRDTTRLFARLRYRHENRDFDATNDGRVWGYDMGIDGEIPFFDKGYRGLRGSVSVGFDYGSYDDGTFNRGGEQLRRDENSREGSIAVQAALQYLMSPRQTAELRYVRSQQFSARGQNFQITDRVDLILNRNLTRQLIGRIAIYGEHSDPSGNTPAQAADDSFLTNNSRDISRWGTGVGLRYAYSEWVDVDLSWDYTRQNGPGAAGSYTNHRMLLGLTIYLHAIRPPRYGGNVQ